jgi:hypothetical protein
MSKKIIALVGSAFVGGALLLVPMASQAGASTVKAHAATAAPIGELCLPPIVLGPIVITVCI